MSPKTSKLMEGKTALITGANTGLGFETARSLASEGACVIMTARNREKGERALATVRQEGGHDRVHLLLADFSEIVQVRRLAQEVLALCPRLDILINNAGLLCGQRSLTPDGHETTFAVNHLAPFLLTRLLLDRLHISAPARIINVSSMVHKPARLDFDDLMMERGYHQLQAYARSKVANILFTGALARRLDPRQVTANSLHPGIVDTQFGHSGTPFYRFLKNLARPFIFISPEKGAQTQIHLARAVELEGKTDGYYVKSRKATPSAYSQEKKVQERLWRVSEELTTLDHWPLPA